MNTFATVIVTNTKKLAAQDVLNALYSTPSTEDTDAVVSTAGDEFFGVELEKGVSKYWASSGAFLSDELTALINSGVVHYLHIDSSFQETIDACGMTKVIVPDEEEAEELGGQNANQADYKI
jgi:hypothetical protein